MGSKNTRFESDIFNTSVWNSYGIEMGNGRNETFTNVQIIAPSSDDIRMTEESLYIRNSSFQKTNTTVLSVNLYTQWYAYTNVTNGTVSLPSITVSEFRNTNFLLIESKLSNSSGQATLLVTEVNKSSGSNIWYYEPHTINATGELVGNYPNSSTVNFTSTNSTTIHLALAEDLSAPNVTFNGPASGPYTSAITINVTVLDDLRVANVSFRHENGTVNSSWFGMTRSGAGTNWTGVLNLSEVSDGNYTIRIQRDRHGVE